MSKSRSSNQLDSVRPDFFVAKRGWGWRGRVMYGWMAAAAAGSFEVENPSLSSVDDFLAVVSPDLSADG